MNVQSIKGLDAIQDPQFVDSLIDIWAISYRASDVAAQSQDSLYLDDRKADRYAAVRSELSTDSCQVVYIGEGPEIMGFFWGLSVADLDAIAPEKAGHIRPFMNGYPSGEVVYLSMLGVHPDRGGKGLGKLLTRSICEVFSSTGAVFALARTINERAFSKVYSPLGFRECCRFNDEKSAGATRIVFGADLPLRATAP